MYKKIAQYLPAALLVLTAAALLYFPGARSDSPGQTVPPSSDVAGETTVPVTAGTDATESQPDPTTASADAMPRVEQILNGYRLEQTAAAVCVYDEKLHADPAGTGKTAIGHALARVCGQRRMNPIAAFWSLEDEGIYSYTPDGDDILGVEAFDAPRQARKKYPYTAKGTRELLTDILDLAREMKDGMDLEGAFLGDNGKVDSDQVFHAQGDCYYAYFVYYGDSGAHFLCFYVRGGEKIDHVEFQMLNLRYKGGTLGRADCKGETQAALLMAATELLLTGTSRANVGNLALGYPIKGGEVTIDRYDVTGPGEIGSLINYGIKLDP